MVSRFALAVLLLASLAQAQPSTKPLTRGLADALYCKLGIGCPGLAGTVTSVSVTAANGVSGSVATPTTTPAITLTLGAITPSSVNGNTITAGSFVLTGSAAKTLTFTNTMTLSGTDATTMTFPSTNASIARIDAAQTFVGHNTFEGVTPTGAIGTGLMVFNNAATFIAPVLGVAGATSVTMTGTAGAGFVEFPAQSSAPSAPASGLRKFADAAGRMSWIRASDGFVRTWDATLTASRIYTLPDAATNIPIIPQTITVAGPTAARTWTTNDVAGTIPLMATAGTATTLAHGSAAGAGAFGAVVSADLNITTTTCTNQFISALSSAVAGTCTGLTLAAFPTMATNTVLGNATSGTAVPTALTVGTCSAAGSALNWTTNTGFGCNTSITASTATTATNATNTAITDDTSTNATMFLTWVTTASGNQAQKTSSTLLTFNPSTGNLGVGVSPSGTTGIRLLTELDGNQITKIQSQNATAGTGAGGSVVATSDVSTAQFTAFSSLYSGTLAGINLAGSSSVNNAGLGTVGFTVGTTSAAPVILMTNATRGLTINASSQAVSLRGTQTNDNAIAGDVGESITAVCPGPTTTATITVTIASPAVVTWTSHPFSGTAPRFDACPVVFTTTGALPTGITASTNYWVVPGSISGNTFSIATSVANAIAATKVNTSGTQSGTQTGTAGTVLSTGATKDITGFALTAGAWDCSGADDFQFGSTTSYTNLVGSISTTSATLGGQDTGFDYETPAAVPTAGADMTWPLPTVPQLFSSTTNVFGVAQATFTLSTLKTYGTIRCRRMR